MFRKYLSPISLFALSKNKNSSNNNLCPIELPEVHLSLNDLNVL
jgi:hypothetical protein